MIIRLLQIISTKIICGQLRVLMSNRSRRLTSRYKITNRVAITLLGLWLAQTVRTILWLHKNDDNLLIDQLMLGLPSMFYDDHCKCVDCEEDEICGGLWRGNRYIGMPSEEEAIHKKVRIVVSHCNKSLDWLPQYLKEVTNVASIHVISKCGQEAEINNATKMVLPNVGRNDHAFAYYIAQVLPNLVTSKNETSVVVFLKDNTKVHQGHWFQRNDLRSLVRIASSVNGFSCGLGIIHDWLSAYHDVATLQEFGIERYRQGEQNGNNTGIVVPFKSEYNDLGDFYRSLNATSIPDLVQVCYGGMFAASTENIFKQDMSVWRALEKSLERGDNIEEGHLAERSWGSLLATPLKPFQIRDLRKHSTEVRIDWGSMHGALESNNVEGW